MIETLLEALTDIRQRLKKEEYKNEEHVRFSLVGRVLQVLGWNLWNPSEVNTEEQPHEENHTKVDISLRIWTPKPAAVYIECKRVNMLLPHLAKVEKQMYDYNGKNAASLIILTDGQHWYLYYPFGQVSFHERLFATYDLATHNLADMAADLTAVVERAAVADGSARKVAEDRWDARRMQQKMTELLPEAKENIVNHSHDRSLNQELVYLMQRHGFPETTVDDIKELRAGGGPSKKHVAIPNEGLANTKAGVAAQMGGLQKLQEQRAPLLAVAPTTPRFKSNGRGSDATALLLPNGQMQVLAGSKVAGTTSKAFSFQKLRDQLQAEGVLKAEGKILVFTSDYVFKSPNTAANVVYGNPVNARVHWKHESTHEPLGIFLAAKPART